MCDNRFMKDPPDRRPPSRRPTSRASSRRRKIPALAAGWPRCSAKVNAKIPDKIEDLQADQIPWNNPHWHPAHGGIYRNVRLIVTDPLHITLPLYSFLQTVGPYVYASDISDKSAKINVEVPIENAGTEAEQNVDVTAEVLDANDKAVATFKQQEQIKAGGKETVKLSGDLANPQLVAARLSVPVPRGRSTLRGRWQAGRFVRSAAGHSHRQVGQRPRPVYQRPAREAARLGSKADRRMAGLGRRSARLDALLSRCN